MYRLLLGCMRLAVKFYFRRISVKNKLNVPEGAVIFAPNHPSGFMDPILLAALSQRELYFIARGESFQAKWRSVLYRAMHMIPIYRPDKTKHLVHKNHGVFKKCFEILKQGKALIMFPEGLSHKEPRLRQIKTGVARIALGAQAYVGSTPVYIVPVGLNYSDPHRFRSDVEIEFGSPISVKDYMEQYIENSSATVREITNELKKRIINSSLHLEDEYNLACADALNKVLSYDLGNKHDLFNPSDFRERSSFIVSKLNQMREARIDSLELKAHRFMYLAQNNNLQPGIYSNETSRIKIETILLTPLAAIGVVVHYFPYRFIGWATDSVISRADFRGSFLLVLGFWVYLAFIGATSSLAAILTGLPLLAAITPLVIIGLGLATLKVSQDLKQDKDLKKLRTLEKIEPHLAEVMRELHAEIISDLEWSLRQVA